MSGTMQALKCCLNWRVLLGLAVVGLGVLLLAPELISRAFPLLLALVCPLSMLLMMGSMAKTGGMQETVQASTPGPAPGAQSSLPEGSVSKDARPALLRAQLQVLDEQRAAVAAEIAVLETPETSAPSRALEEAEQAARDAEGAASAARGVEA